MSKKVHIIGAGLSGMVAGINLAKRGHEVLIIEAAKGIGGIKNVHPSTHATPLNRKLIWNYIGIDLKNHFLPVRSGEYYIKKKSYPMDNIELFIVERGDRRSSLDNFLYNEARKAGVKFEFSNFITNPLDMPDPTIIASGLNHEMYDYLNIPYLKTNGYGFFKEVKGDPMDGMAFAWFGNYTIDYGYAAMANNLQYFLLFSRLGLKDGDLKKYQDHLRDTQGIKIDNWRFYEGAVPIASIKNPRLFAGNKILAGTITGMMDPAMMFGIHGALMSGRIAALAVEDKEKAVKDFKHYTRHFTMTLLNWKVSSMIPLRLMNMKLMIKFPNFFLPFQFMMGNAIPGYEKNWMREYFGGKSD